MLYNNYVEKLFGNKTKIAMLRAFYKIPDKIWSSRDLAKFIGTYNTTILDNLGDLEDMGLIYIGMHGHVKTIKLNKESFVFTDVVKTIFRKEGDTFKELIETIKTIINKKDVELLAVFGSIVEKKEKPASDIDLLIVTRNKEKIDKLLTEKQCFISSRFGNEISPHIMSPQEFKGKQSTPYIKEAKKNYVIIHGEWL